MQYGICNLSIIPLRFEPADPSELVSQVLYGEHFKILEQRKKWSRIRLAFDNYEGFIIAKKELLKLSNHCKINSLNCHIILMPDIHKLNPYKLNFINKKMKKISAELEFQFHDLLSIFEGKNEKTVWNKHGDPHPNAYANTLMSENIFLY